MRRDVRILLVGDDGVGKSTLITSLIKEQFIPNIQHVVPEVTIPPEVTPENVTTHIVDSSARPENAAQLELEIRKANVICIVYAVDDHATFERIPLYWLPYIKSLGVNIPIVLVGNKIDIRGEDVTNELLEEEILPIMTEFKEVETCVECSAKQSLNISEVFYFAQKAVLHPTAPLYDSREHVMKPECAAALERIFKLCDSDKDGALNDDELNEFQRKCFNAPLQQQELEGVKDVVQESDPEGLNDRGLTLSGFLFLHTLFIQKGRLETTWTVLRKFGYGDDLSLRDEFLCPPLDVPTADGVVELSSAGHAFFTDLFRKHDVDQDGALSPAELDDLFATSPGNPWVNPGAAAGTNGSAPTPAASPSSSSTLGPVVGPAALAATTAGFLDAALTNASGALTLQGFLSQWAMTTLLDYKTTLAYLAYLGYDGDTRQALKVLRRRRAGGSASTSGAAAAASAVVGGARRGTRSAFLCYVFGAAGAGKTALLRRFVDKPVADHYTQTTRPLAVVNAVEVKGSEVYLVLQEFGSKYESEVLTNRKRLEQCDVALFVYDSSDVNSFAYVAQQIKQLDSSIPCVIVATKSDLDLVQQRYEVPPDVFCRQLELDKPIHISVKDNIMADVYNVVSAVAMNPVSAIPKGKSRRPERSPLGRYLAITAAVGATAAVGFAVWRMYKSGELLKRF
ncbi:small GTP-binding protein domain [Allomyces macrogynus ATCC 38327]|uniref:Mitochondrial Rho GTPase n=1 Tax=Allomyces macrogynus (strain ATCC 38327) TaxID=578462 RepID=A0A0L0T5Y8_ALLM3|nr:small GTP-binding protein domain [Allomyces macrogynus ATCC 38327]|eukprot:KNE70213.1 small GTP-binding protein domain [Allomyces macrogynus ATCC 38327]